MNTDVPAVEQQVLSLLQIRDFNMRWRLYLFLILAFLGIGIAFLGGYYAHEAKYYAVSAVLFFLAINIILLGLGFAQDDGAECQKKEKGNI